jgi:hypothetical protein
MSSDQKTTTISTDVTPIFQLNQKKLKELAENASAIKIGGKVGGILILFFFLKISILFRVQLVVRRKLFIVQQMLMIKNFKVH